ncbi:MAG: DUF4397 domain-containing protein [Bacilli bacterium]
MTNHWLEKAIQYELLANIYKYTQPDLALHYYRLHIEQLKSDWRALEDGIAPGHLQFFEFPARVRFLNLTAEPLTKLNMNASNVLDEQSANTLTDWVTLAPGTYTLSYSQNGVSGTRSFPVKTSQSYTLVATRSGNVLTWFVLTETPQVPDNESSIRFAHFAGTVGPVDVALTEADTLFANVQYGDVSKFIQTNPMTLPVEVRPSGEKQALVLIPALKLEAGLSHTLIATQNANGVVVFYLLPYAHTSFIAFDI